MLYLGEGNKIKVYGNMITGIMLKYSIMNKYNVIK